MNKPYLMETIASIAKKKFCTTHRGFVQRSAKLDEAPPTKDIMPPQDLVQLSLLPYCAALPQDRNEQGAALWAEETCRIILKDTGVMDMRLRRTIELLMDEDWAQGLQALLPLMKEYNGSLAALDTNSMDPRYNLMVNAAARPLPQILDALLVSHQKWAPVNDQSLARTIDYLADHGDTSTPQAGAVIEEIARRPNFLERNSPRSVARSMLSLLDKGRADLVAAALPKDNTDLLLGEWILQGAVDTFVSWNEKDQITDGRWAADLLARSQSLRRSDWVKTGNALAELYLNHRPREISRLVELMATLLASPDGRELIPTLAAWNTRRHLGDLIDGEPLPEDQKPGRPFKM
jgi:hypothetical protein